MMHTSTAILLSAAALSAALLAPMAAQELKQPQNPRIQQVMKGMRSAARDPSSVEFRELRIGKRGFVCGEVNAKNGFGGMTGFVQFVVDDQDEIFMVQNQFDESKRKRAETMFMVFCGSMV